MAKAHLLADGQVAFHIPVGVGNNTAGVAWTDALVRSGMGGSSILVTGTLPGQITAAELASIQAGTVVEVVQTLQLEGVAPAGLKAYLQAEYARLQADHMPEVKRSLRYWGETVG